MFTYSMDLLGSIGSPGAIGPQESLQPELPDGGTQPQTTPMSVGAAGAPLYEPFTSGAPRPRPTTFGLPEAPPGGADLQQTFRITSVVCR